MHGGWTLVHERTCHSTGISNSLISTKGKGRMLLKIVYMSEKDSIL